MRRTKHQDPKTSQPPTSAPLCLWALALLWLVGLAAGLAVSATESATSPTGQVPSFSFSDQASVAWVLVPVTVRNRAGSLVEDLEQADFRLMLGDQEIPIESFEHGVDAPVSLIHLQDLSGSMDNGEKLSVSRRVLRYFLDRASAGDEFALATFASGRTAVEVPFTDRLEPLGESMAAWTGWGTTALHDAVAWLPDMETAGRNPKRAALLLTDGDDNASQLDPAFARRVVRQAELPVYVLDLTDRSQSEGNVETAGDGELLQRLATTSGGRYFAIDTRATAPTELLAACRAIAEELRYQYVLGFQTRSSGDAAYHSLQVEVSRPRLAVQHRQGYSGTLPGTLKPMQTGRLALPTPAPQPGPAFELVQPSPGPARRSFTN